jgi:hypothetical protein
MWALTRRLVVIAVTCVIPATAIAQVDLKPTPAPTITAENAPWYQAKEPITFAGNEYYPAGAQVFFVANEMVRSGVYKGIPLYTRTTIEPYSKVFVPLPGNAMQPYERRRAGELAGTVGGAAPSFPVQRSTDPVPDATAGGNGAQAAGPPTNLSSSGAGNDAGQVSDVRPVPPAPAAAPAQAAPPPRRGKMATAAKPTGLNAVFIEYKGRKWFSNGTAVELEPSRFRVIGTYHDMPVYADRRDKTGKIYVPVEKSSESLIAPYSARP